MSTLAVGIIIGLVVAFPLGYVLRLAIRRDEVADACRDRDVLIRSLEARIHDVRVIATRWATTTVVRGADPVQASCGRAILTALSEDR